MKIRLPFKLEFVIFWHWEPKGWWIHWHGRLGKYCGPRFYLTCPLFYLEIGDDIDNPGLPKQGTKRL